MGRKGQIANRNQQITNENQNITFTKKSKRQCPKGNTIYSITYMSPIAFGDWRLNWDTESTEGRP